MLSTKLTPEGSRLGPTADRGEGRDKEVEGGGNEWSGDRGRRKERAGRGEDRGRRCKEEGEQRGRQGKDMGGGRG